MKSATVKRLGMLLRLYHKILVNIRPQEIYLKFEFGFLGKSLRDKKHTC